MVALSQRHTVGGVLKQDLINWGFMRRSIELPHIAPTGWLSEGGHTRAPHPVLVGIAQLVRGVVGEPASTACIGAKSVSSSGPAEAEAFDDSLSPSGDS